MRRTKRDPRLTSFVEVLDLCVFWRYSAQHEADMEREAHATGYIFPAFLRRACFALHVCFVSEEMY